MLTERQIELDPGWMEQRFIQNGTVVVTHEGALLQAIIVRGSSKTREIHFAASNKCSHAAVKTKPSAVVASDLAGGFSHVFRNMVGDAAAAVGPPPALMFAVTELLAEVRDNMELKTVRLSLSPLLEAQRLSGPYPRTRSVHRHGVSGKKRGLKLKLEL